MATIIYTYTGTGNALWAARRIAEGVGDAAVLPIPGATTGKQDVVGLVFPVYMWGTPTPVMDFIRRLAGDSPGYIFAVGVNAGELGRTLLMADRTLKSRGLGLSAGWGLRTPSNYIPWGGPGTPEELDAVFREAERKLETIIKAVKERQKRNLERGGWRDGVKSALFHAVSMKQVPKMDNSFRLNDRCTGCGICAEVCPAENIALSDGRPVWSHQCHQCFACLQWCPTIAIEYGKSARYERYHHPEVSQADIKTLRARSRTSLN